MLLVCLCPHGCCGLRTCCPAGPGCLCPHGCWGRRRARPPARLGGLTSFGAAPRSPPVPSGPSGALHTCGAWSLFGSSTRRLVARRGGPRAPLPGLPISPVPLMSVAVGVLHYMKPSGGVSPACRSLMSCNSPRLVAVRAWLWLVWCPKCRPPRRKPLKTGCCGRGGLRFGHNGARHRAPFARKPLNMHVNPLIRT